MGDLVDPGLVDADQPRPLGDERASGADVFGAYRPNSALMAP
jgi:hypothetical protein